MHNFWHQRDGIETLDVLSTGGRGHANIEDGMDSSILEMKGNIKRQRKTNNNDQKLHKQH